MIRLYGRLLPLLLGAVFAGYLASAPDAMAASKEQVRSSIEKTFGVKVLRIRDMLSEGRAAFAVTIMNPGGNFDEAFQVNTIVVDRATGKLISQFRHRDAGYDLSNTLDRNTSRAGG